MKILTKIIIFLILSAATISILYITPKLLPYKSWFFRGGFQTVAISTDGNYIVAGGDGISYFHKSNSKPIWSYKVDSEINSVAISANGSYIVAGGMDKKVYFFHMYSSTPLWSNTTGSGVLSVAISSDGNYIAAGGQDGILYLFDKSSSIPLWINSTGAGIHRVEISSDGSYIAITNGFGLQWYNRTNSTPEQSAAGGLSMAISSDGNYIVAGDMSTIYLYHTSSSSPLWAYSIYAAIDSLDISSDGNYIVAGCDNSYIYLFDKSISTPLWQYRIEPFEQFDSMYDAISVSISSNGEYIAATHSSFSNRINKALNTYFFHRSKNIPLWSRQNGGGSVTISSDGSYVATANPSGLFLFNIESPTSLWDFRLYNIVIIIIIGSIPIVLLIALGIRRKILKARGIRVFISHAVMDFNRYRIVELAKYLESRPEISHVYYCEEDLTGNIDDWMNKTIPRCQLLIFFSSESSLNSEDCMNELRLARKHNLEIAPVLGVNLRWEDLEKLNINRELGQEFDPMEFDKFKKKVYNYVIKFAQNLEKEITEKKKTKKNIKA